MYTSAAAKDEKYFKSTIRNCVDVSNNSVYEQSVGDETKVSTCYTHPKEGQ